MQKWQCDMKKCPDCGNTYNAGTLKAGDHCTGGTFFDGYNHECESAVFATRTGKLYWWNENWG